MTSIQKWILAAVFCGTMGWVSGGTAEDQTLGDLGIRARQGNIDPYWSDSKIWAEYGYRPHVTSHLQRFTSLPTAYTSKGTYAWGDNPPAANMTDILGRSSKADVQMTKFGTWH